MPDTVPLREYLEHEVCHLRKEMELQFKLNQTAIDKFEETNKLQHASMNEFRASITDQRNEFATRREVSFLTKLVYIGLGMVLAMNFYSGSLRLNKLSIKGDRYD